MKNTHTLPKLGIDIGRVLIAPEGANGADTSFIGGSMDDALRTPPYEGMFDAVAPLVARFEGRVWLVSKCGPSVQAKSRAWLQHHRFFERTGIAPGNLRFCLQRPQKADHCRELGITHFIDDRSDVLRHLEGIVPHRYLFGPQGKPVTVAGLVLLPAWKDAAALVD
ncbi:hypothetical protein GNX71_30425 [Variovorax sp. RKNM96]|uniref:hypothetical protein n=1 Tax=Variovorax sp. RKNM96 TaxID=2681552 RepID=UPI00198182EB|nr:hypothetical protein [Variovorax sp. RKNM96]QSI33649.1 hypothetical protein GNX71_30425 [Variovorax sp. RKNM96]